MQLEPRLRAIVAQEYPRFSDAEFARRHQALARVMQKHDQDGIRAATQRSARLLARTARRRSEHAGEVNVPG